MNGLHFHRCSHRNAPRRWLVGVGAALAVVALSVPLAAAEREPPAGDARWEQVDPDQLIRLLLRARRLDPEGQKLLRNAAHLRSLLNHARLRVSELLADRKVSEGLELILRPDAQSRLAAMKALPPGQLTAAYRQFLADFQLDDLVMEQVFEVESLRRKIEGWEKEMADTEEKLVRHEQDVPVAVPASFFDRPSGWDLPLARTRSERGPSRSPSTLLDPASSRRLTELLQNVIQGTAP